jgi:hypothetical protein
MLRPQDVAVLLELCRVDPLAPLTDLAAVVCITPAQVQQALRRAAAGSLVRLGPHRGRAPQQKVVNRLAFLELLLHGVRYVYPAQMGGESRGIPSFSKFAPTVFNEALQPVWPDADGEVRGLALKPLYPQATKAARRDPAFHEALACIDALRIGNARERQWATAALEKWVRHE